MSDAAFFAKARLFQGLSEQETQTLAAAAVRRSVPAGHVLLRTGAVNDSLFVIRSGQVAVARLGVEQELHLATLGPGEVLGELSFMDASQATGTLRALGPTELLELSRASFDELLAKQPELGAKLWRNIALHLKDRLLASNRVVDHYADLEQLLRDHPEYGSSLGGI